jgi:hypothetical protein
MSGSSFDLIAQELIKHHNLMERLRAENRELREQLANLREGRGIFLEINGQRFALGEQVQAPELPVATTQTAQTTAPQSEVALVSQSIPPTIADAPTVAIAVAITEVQPEANEAEEPAEPQKEIPGVESSAPVSSFLEEAMIDEFAAAMTSPMAVWQGPIKKEKNIDEEKKATIRRELLGSYILE